MHKTICLTVFNERTFGLITDTASLVHLLVRSVGRSVVPSAGASVGRLIVRSVNNPVLSVFARTGWINS